jgi:hypothetical protein
VVRPRKRAGSPWNQGVYEHQNGVAGGRSITCCTRGGASGNLVGQLDHGTVCFALRWRRPTPLLFRPLLFRLVRRTTFCRLGGSDV